MKKLFFVAAVAVLCGLGSCSTKGHCVINGVSGGTYSGSSVDVYKAACTSQGGTWVSE